MEARNNVRMPMMGAPYKPASVKCTGRDDNRNRIGSGNEGGRESEGGREGGKGGPARLLVGYCLVLKS